MIITKEHLQKHWSNGEKIQLRGKSFKVGKMSYGNYFLEPGKPGRETEPFNVGTLWPKQILNSTNYEV